MTDKERLAEIAKLLDGFEHASLSTLWDRLYCAYRLASAARCPWCGAELEACKRNRRSFGVHLRRATC